MKISRSGIRAVAAAAILALWIGCDGGGGSNGVVGPDIRGHWKGTYEIRNIGNDEKTPLNADIDQNGEVVNIDTTLPQIGHHFTGKIDPYGEMELTDAWDGEEWTTHSGPATETFVDIEDYRFDLNPEAIAVITLTR